MATIWSIKDLHAIAINRQNNKFDFNLAVSGNRGNGKSTLLFKFFKRFRNFKPWDQMIYTRKDVMRLLEGQKRSPIFDDEAIRTGYKRNFYDQDQKTLIQMLNMYRDNFNIYGIAIPSFYALDKDLRSLIKMHIHVIRRGLGVVHIANDDNLYSTDPWDVQFNKKIEENWARRKQKNPNYSPQYHKLTTFKGYIHFGDLTVKQRELYEEIKVKKRKAVYIKEMQSDEDVENDFYLNLIKRLQEGHIHKELLQEICLAMNKNYSNVLINLNRRLTNKGIKETVSQLYKLPLHNVTPKVIHNNPKEVIKKFGYRPL